MRLSKKQRALALSLFGTDRLTRRQFSKMMDERKRVTEAAYDSANEVNLLDLAERYTTMTVSGNTRTGPCPMTGCTASKDGFWVDTRTNTGGCHSCFWPNGVGSGPVGFLRALTGCEAWEARDQLIGEIEISMPTTLASPQCEAEAPEVTKDFTAVMTAATANLRASAGGGKWGRSYLTGRGIKRETWERFGIGVVTDYGYKGFIASPFHHADSGQLCGIRYSNAKISAKGSKFKRAAFGLPALQGLPIAFVVEGEMNAKSIWQVCSELNRSVDVVSVGSQGAFKSLAPDLAKFVSQARLVVIWADEWQIGNAVKPFFERQGVTVQVLYSYNKLDANNLLMSDELSRLLLSILPKDDEFFAKSAPLNNEKMGITKTSAQTDSAATSSFLTEEATKVPTWPEIGDMLDEVGNLLNGLTSKASEEQSFQLYKEFDLALVNDDFLGVKRAFDKIKQLYEWEALRRSATRELQNNALFL